MLMPARVSYVYVYVCIYIYIRHSLASNRPGAHPLKAPGVARTGAKKRPRSARDTSTVRNDAREGTEQAHTHWRRRTFAHTHRQVSASRRPCLKESGGSVPQSATGLAKHLRRQNSRPQTSANLEAPTLAVVLEDVILCAPAGGRRP